jgi:hypothetical protein
MDQEQIQRIIAQMQQTMDTLVQRNRAAETAAQAAQVDRADALNRLRNLEANMDGAIAAANAAAAAAAGGAAAGGGGHAGGFAAPAPLAAPRGPPRMPNLVYEGKETDDWVSFRQAFENVTRFYAYDQEHAKWALKSCMRGVAFLTVSSIDHEDPDETLTDLLEDYEAKFMPPAASDLARARFETAVQGPKEVILQWHGRLLLLWTRAYGGGGHRDDVAEAILVRTFARGLRVKAVREHVLRTQPANYNAALNAAQTEQAVIDSGSYIPGSNPSFANNIGGHGSGGAKNHGGAEPMEIGAINATGNKVQCHTCHLFGHIARECTLMKKPQGAKGGAAATTGGAAGAAARGGARPKTRPDGPVKGKGETDKKGPRRGRFINAIAEALADFDAPEEEEEKEEEPTEEGEEEAEEEASADF